VPDRSRTLIHYRCADVVTINGGAEGMIEATEPEQLADLLLELLGLFVGIAPELRSAVGMGLVADTNLLVL